MVLRKLINYRKHFEKLIEERKNKFKNGFSFVFSTLQHPGDQNSLLSRHFKMEFEIVMLKLAMNNSSINIVFLQTELGLNFPWFQCNLERAHV